MRREVVEVGGVNVSYLTEGAGWPLLLLHGIWESAVDWQWVLPEFAGQYLVLAPDLPGAGESQWPPESSVDYYARFIGRFLDALGLERAILVGNSLGGLIAVRFAAGTPQRIAALVLADSAGLGPEIHPGAATITWPGVGDTMMLWAMTPLGAAQRSWLRTRFHFAKPSRAPSEWLAEQTRLARRPGYLVHWLTVFREVAGPQGQRVMVLDQLERLNLPSLVVWGADDRLFPLAQGQRAAERFPQGQLEVIADCGHLPQVERPDLFLRVVRPFLEKAVA